MPGREVTQIPAKQYGLMLPYPTLYTPNNWTVSCLATVILVVALWVWTEFRSGNYSMMFKDVRVEIQRQNILNSMQVLEEVVVKS